MEREFQNVHGRRPGRGVRPWLLLPKVVAVGLYVGGVAAALVSWVRSGFDTLDKADPRRLWTINQVGGLLEFLAVPGLLVAIGFGVALLLQHPRQFIRMRWLVVKLATLAVMIPSAHLYMSSRLRVLREAYATGVADPRASAQVTWGLAAVLAVSIWVVALGRLKPRLGQNWAKSYARSVKEG